MRNFGTEPREPRAFIYGIHPVIEAIEAGKELEAVLIQKGLTGALLQEMKDLARTHEITVQ